MIFFDKLLKSSIVHDLIEDYFAHSTDIPMFPHTFKIEIQNLRALPKHINSIKIRNETCLIVFTTIRIAGGVMFLKQIRTSIRA